MRINLQHLNLRSRDRLDRWVEEQILALGATRRIDEAHVRLECRGTSSPPFAVHLHLVTPGLDVFAESSDHTLHAAFTKALNQLRGNIASRDNQRRRRWKRNSSAPTTQMRGRRSR